MLAVLLIVGAGIVGLGAYAWFSRDLPDPNKLLERNVELSTKIYDRTGQHLLYDIHGAEKRTYIELSDIPDYAKWSVILLEDQNFYEHGGIKITSIIRAFLANIFSGGKSQGGSTITQQFVKNAILTTEKTYSRKIKEIILSLEIERKFSKDQILKMYFNEIPWGSTAYGIEAASQTYFGKSVKDLSISQSALLAAMVQRPTYYSPYGSHTDELLWRKNHVLDLLKEKNYINETEYNQAKSEDVLKEVRSKQESITAPHFVMFVKEYLADQYGENEVEQAGLKVITTLDYDKQMAAEKATTDGMDKIKKNNGSNAALVALDPKTGQILAMVGSKDFFDKDIDGQVNVTIMPRQPGSSFKPIVYSAAFAKGYTPDTILYDVLTAFKTDIGKDYIPHNYDLKEHGPVTMKKALAGSLNIPAVKTIYLVGIDKVIEQAKNMGYTTFGDLSNYGLSLVLGGGEVKLLEHTNAFGIFAREGLYKPYTAIMKIEDKNGNTLEEYKNDDPPAKKVLDTEVCRKINNILTDNSARAFIFGTNNYLTLGDRPVAAKTGTTNDYHDAWTIGYTPSLVAGVWVGNNNNKEMKKGADGSVVAAPIWNAFMKASLGNSPAETFNPPAPDEVDKPVLQGKLGNQQILKIDKASGKLATELTPPDYAEERTYSQVHCILYYVNKDDPRGPTPTDPNADPQFHNWEIAVQEWSQKQCDLKKQVDEGAVKLKDNEQPPLCINTNPPPILYDDVHVPENKPTIEIISPTSNQTVSKNFEANVRASAPRGISKIEYIVDGQLVDTKTTAPFDLSYGLNDFSNGFHELKVKAYDDVDNQNEAVINFNLLK